MPYTSNPDMPQVRMQAVKKVREGWSTREAAHITTHQNLRFVESAREALPFPISTLQTGRGSEFSK